MIFCYIIIVFFILLIKFEITMNTGFVSVTGGKIWYKILGADKKGIPMLVLHGGPGAPHDYLENLEILADERPIIFYDQLGCGNSDRPVDNSLWNVDRFVEEIVIIKKELNLNKFNLFGQSWGSMLAVKYYLDITNNGVNSLILSGPCLSAVKFTEDVRKMVNQLPEKEKNIIFESEEKGDFSSLEFQQAMEVFYAKHVCQIIPPPESFVRTMEKMGADVYNYMWGPSEFSVFGTIKDIDLTNQLEKISVPTILICGEFDEASPETTKMYSSKIKNSKCVVLNGASHMHNLEKPKEFIFNVRQFLQKVEK